MIEGRNVDECRGTVHSHEKVLPGEIGLIVLGTEGRNDGSRKPYPKYLTALTAEVVHLLRRTLRPFGGALLVLGRKSILEYTIR